MIQGTPLEVDSLIEKRDSQSLDGGEWQATIDHLLLARPVDASRFKWAAAFFGQRADSRRLFVRVFLSQRQDAFNPVDVR